MELQKIKKLLTAFKNLDAAKMFAESAQNCWADDNWSEAVAMIHNAEQQLANAKEALKSVINQMGCN